jgi:hypothetical protein
MHSKTVTIGGLDLELALTFGAARELSQKVGDIIGIVNEARLEAMMSAAGLVHQPKWVPTVENVPMILWIGAKHADPAIKLDAVQAAVFDHGFLEAKVAALDYVAMLATPSAREKMDDLPEAGGGQPGE